MQLFFAGMRVPWVTRVGREAYQHAHSMPFSIGREPFAFDPRRNLFPFRLRPLLSRRQHWWLAGLLGDTTSKAGLQRCRQTQHIGGPGD